MSDLVERICELSESYRENLIKFIRDMIAIPSTSCHERRVIERISQEMESCGFDEVKVDGLGNIIGRIGHGKTIIAMDAHIDTVDVGDRNTWRVDPFKGALKDGIIYGRGASDQEGGMASMTYAGKIIKELGLEGDYTLYVTGTVQEEDCDGMPWDYIINKDNIKPDFCVITEPTNLNIYRGHRGRMEIAVTTHGKSCHGSAPERGENALYKMVPIIQGIEKLNSELEGDSFLGKGTVAVTQIRSSSPSQCAVIDECTIYLDRRLSLGETKESAISEIMELCKDADAAIDVPVYETPSYTGVVHAMEKYFPTWCLNEEHVLTRSAAEAFKTIFKSEPKVDKWVFSTNGVVVMGKYGIPCIGFGPGNEVYSHGPEDQVPVSHLVEACKFYALFPKVLMEKINGK